VESHNTYIVEVNANENIAPHTLEYTGAINITIILRGDGVNRTIRLSSNGTMFTVRTNVTFILDNNITLQGHSQNNGTMVYINGGIFRMNAGSVISGNTRSNDDGGGVYLGSGTFTMTGGTISGNTATYGGGVYISSGTFEMTGGTISGNFGGSNSGVVYGGSNVFFASNSNNDNWSMVYAGGVSSDNWSMVYAGGSSEVSNSGGGGVAIMSNGIFNMKGGAIMGNTAFGNNAYGGGVLVSGTLNKTGGTITGYNSDQSNGNVVRDASGTIARRGHAVYISSTKRRETTAGPGVNLSSNNDGNWDN